MQDFDLNAFWFACANFVILVALLYRFLHRPVLEALDKRRERIQKAQRDAQEQFEEARARQQDYEKKLAEIGREREAVLSEARKKAEEGRESTLKGAREEAQREVENMKASFERERADALRRMRGEIVGTSVGLAGAILAKASDDELQDKLVQALVREIDDVKGRIDRRTREGLVEGGAPVRVLSARELDEDQRKDLCASVCALVGEDVEVTFETDESLIAGARVELSSMAVDASVADALESVREELAESASAETETDEAETEAPGNEARA